MSFSAEYSAKIESRQNGRIRQLRSALRRAVKSPDGSIAIEGEHLLEEALRSGLKIRTIFVRLGRENRLPPNLPDDAEILLVNPEAFDSAVSTDHPQGVAAIVSAPHFNPEQMFHTTPMVIVTASLQDPGNVGTLLRSAEAFGATGMILLPGTASLWNGKTLRASSGSAFRLPALSMTADEMFSTLRSKGISLFAAVAHDGDSEANFSGPTAILIGNEGAGLPQDWLSRVDHRITIPCPGGTESLNAAVAGSVLLYEAACQRFTPGLSPRRLHGSVREST